MPRARVVGRVIIKQTQLANLLDEITSRDLERRAQLVLQKAKETVPRASGDFANSLRVVKTRSKGKVVARITTNDPNIVSIRKGTKGPYAYSPANVPRIQRWMVDVGIPASRSQAVRMAKAIAFHGTPPAGTSSGKPLDEILKEAMRAAL